jgi:hypothetical protein
MKLLLKAKLLDIFMTDMSKLLLKAKLMHVFMTSMSRLLLKAKLMDILSMFARHVTLLMEIKHSRTQSPSYARCDEGLWPNPKPETIKTW